MICQNTSLLLFIHIRSAKPPKQEIVKDTFNISEFLLERVKNFSRVGHHSLSHHSIFKNIFNNNRKIFSELGLFFWGSLKSLIGRESCEKFCKGSDRAS